MTSGVLTQEQRNFIDVSRVARIATVSEEGQPHNVPVCPILDEDDRIWFATDEGPKVRNVRANPRVCVAFDDYTELWTDLRQIIVFGRAEVIAGEDPRFLALRDAFYAKYPQYLTMAEGVEPEDSLIIGVTIERIATYALGSGAGQ